MQPDSQRGADPNLLLGLRYAMFTDPGVIETVANVYGLVHEPLGIAVEGAAISLYRSERAGRRRVMLAPFNFQPVCRDDGDRIVRALIARASAGGRGTSAVIRLHHTLPAETVVEFGLGVTSESVETLLALPRGADAALAALPQKQRWKFRKAQTAAGAATVTVRRFSDAATLSRFYNVMVRAYRDKHRMLPQPESLFRGLLATSGIGHRCFGYVAERADSGQMLGGIFMLADHGQWCYGWGANEPAEAVEALDLGTLLIGTAILDAAAEGVPVFSFGASPVSHELLRRFKRKWGGVEHGIHTYAWGETLKATDLHEGYGLAKSVLARIPIPVLKLLSPRVVKWLV